MSVMIIRGLIGLLSLLYLAMAAGFALDPVGWGGNFFLKADGVQGLATLRADYLGFFGVIGGAMAWGALNNRSAIYWAPIALLGLTMVGRLLSLMLDGVGVNAFPPLIVEAVSVGLCLLGMRLQPR